MIKRDIKIEFKDKNRGKNILSPVGFELTTLSFITVDSKTGLFKYSSMWRLCISQVLP